MLKRAENIKRVINAVVKTLVNTYLYSQCHNAVKMLQYFTDICKIYVTRDLSNEGILLVSKYGPPRLNTLPF